MLRFNFKDGFKIEFLGNLNFRDVFYSYDSASDVFRKYTVKSIDCDLIYALDQDDAERAFKATDGVFIEK